MTGNTNIDIANMHIAYSLVELQRTTPGTFEQTKGSVTRQLGICIRAESAHSEQFL